MDPINLNRPSPIDFSIVPSKYDVTQPQGSSFDIYKHLQDRGVNPNKFTDSLNWVPTPQPSSTTSVSIPNPVKPIQAPDDLVEQNIKQNIDNQYGPGGDNSTTRGNAFIDTGTRMLSGLKTFGGSVIGDAIQLASPDAANAVSKYTGGLVSPTPQSELVANRTGDWNSRINNASEAISSQVGGELVGGGNNIVNGAKETLNDLKNIPGITADVPELGFHKLDSKHWALHPGDLDTSNKNIAMLYGEAALNRTLPLIKNTPLSSPLKRLAEEKMSQSSLPTRDFSEVFSTDTKEGMTYTGREKYTGSRNNNDRNLIKLYLYGDETGFNSVTDDMEKLDFGNRYRNLYPNAKYYIMDSHIGNGDNLNLSDINDSFGFNTPGNGIETRPNTYVSASEFSNPIYPIDNIAGHQVMYKKNPIDNSGKLITQDLWKFNPKDYSNKWNYDNIGDIPISNRLSFNKLTAEKQSAIIDKLGNPFYLVQNNPVLEESSKKYSDITKKYSDIIKKYSDYTIKPSDYTIKPLEFDFAKFKKDFGL